MNNKTREISIIFGRTGSGKSYLTKQLIKNMDRVIIIDSLNEYNEGIIVNNLKEFATFFLQRPNIKRFKVIVRFHNNDLSKDLSDEFNILFDLIYHIGNLTLVLEEAEIYISKRAEKTVFNNLIRFGRHSSISMIAIARRVTELSNNLKSQVNYFYSFKQTLPKDIEYLKELGFTKVETLGPFEFEKVEYS